jgi:hypothetical protein
VWVGYEKSDLYISIVSARTDAWKKDYTPSINRLNQRLVWRRAERLRLLAFKVFLHPKAAKAVEKLYANAKARIKEVLKEFAGNPEKVGKQLMLSDFWSLRIGDYSAIYARER